MILRGVMKLVAVVALAGAVGAGLGIGLAELTGGDDPPSVAPAASTPTTPTATTPTATTPASPAAGTEKLPVEIIDVIARPAKRGAEGARLTVRVRAENNTGKILRRARPTLIVDGDSIAAAADTDGVAGKLLAPSLGSGESAKGTLRFGIPATTDDELATAKVRLRIFGKRVAIKPVVAESTAG